MIEARHTPMGRLVSRMFSGPGLGRAFREVNIIGDGAASERPVLMIANHFSWWDGFIQYRLNRAVFGRRLYVMMLEEQLRENMILNKCGCFSIRKNSRGIIESLDYAGRVLKDEGNMLLIFPQGEIETMHTDTVKFQSGLGYLLKRIGGEIDVVMNVNLPDYFSEKKPALNVYFKTLDRQEPKTLPGIEEQFNDFYMECRINQNDFR